MTTPLLEYLKIRKQEKQRLKDEKREERRRRDIERRRTKDDPIVSKVEQLSINRMTNTVQNNNFLLVNSISNSSHNSYTLRSLLVFADTEHFRLQYVNSVEGNLSSNFLISHPAIVKFEDTFFQCFVENASARKCRKEILFSRFIYERAQEKICKTHQRFHEYVNKTKPIRNMSRNNI